MQRRMGRRAFWTFVAINYAAVSVLQLAASGLVGILFRHGANMQAIALLANPTWWSVLYLPSFVMTARRFHDTGRSAWPVWLFCPLFVGRLYVLMLGMWLLFTMGGHVKGSHALQGAAMYGSLFGPAVLLLLVPGLWILYVCCQPGEADSNRFGPPPGRDRSPASDSDEGDADAALEPLRPAAPVRAAPPTPGKSFGKRPSF